MVYKETERRLLHNKFVENKLKTEAEAIEEDIQIEHIGKVDGPRIRNLKVTNKTTNSITVEVETANAEGATYTYYYKKGGETDWKKAEEIKEKTYTFSGLESNVIYNIKVRVEKAGVIAGTIWNALNETEGS